MSFSKHFSCVSKGTYLIWSINAALCTSSTILHCPREITIERSLFILIFCPGVQLCHPMKLNNIPMQTRILMTFENFELRIYTKIDINTCALTCFCSFFMRNLWLWIKCPLLSDLDCLPDRLFCLVLQQSVYQKRDVRNAADGTCDDRAVRRGRLSDIRFVKSV